MIQRSPHDQFVKAILQQPELAKAYFRQQLPDRLLSTIDLDGLHQVSESFLDENLKESFSDLLYKVPLKNDANTFYLSLLLEHKSYADPYVTIQMGLYIFSALLRQIRNGEKPMPVIPILLYHGKESMPYKTHRQLYANLSQDILEYIPDFCVYPIRALGFARSSFQQNNQALRRRGIAAYGEEGKCLIMKQK